MDKVSFILYIKADSLYIDIAEKVRTSFDTSKYKLDKQFSEGKIKK